MAGIIIDVADALHEWDDYAQSAQIPENIAAAVKADFQIEQLTRK